MITKEEFEKAKVGDAFVDRLGREWRVVDRDSRWLNVMVDGSRDRLMWLDGHIVEIELEINPDLDHPEAFVRRA